MVEVDQFVATDSGTLGPGFIAEHGDDVPSVGQGDSGGPVVTPVPGGSLDVTARGLISLGFEPFSVGDECLGLTTEGRISSARTFHINIVAIEDELLLTVNTE